MPRFVEEVRVMMPEAGRATHVERLPDGRTSLVVRLLDGGRTGDVSVAGPRTRAHFKSTSSVTRVVSVTLKPGWSTPLLGVATHALTDRIVFLDEIWGHEGGALAVDLVTARTSAECIERLARALSSRAERGLESASARLARRAVTLIEAGEGRVESVASQLGVTPRHLRRAFVESVGIGPKEFARTVRLQRAVRMANASKDWGRIAVEAGYYDQAHLIAEFRELVGLTPSAFRVRASAPASSWAPAPSVASDR